MAKFKEVCTECEGQGRRHRRCDDVMWQKPDLKDILVTYPDQLCESCNGTGKVLVNVTVAEKPKS